MAKKNRTTKKSKKSSAYLEFTEGSSNKFWEIQKNGGKITTRYGKIGTDGSSTTKDYGSKVDHEYDKLIQSKKKKGYTEGQTNSSKQSKLSAAKRKLDCKKLTRYHKKGRNPRFLQWPPVMTGIPAGKNHAYKYLGKYNKFSDEPVSVRKGLTKKKVKHYDELCGDRQTATKSDLPNHPGSKKYFMHDNGGRPFLVYVSGNNVWIYKKSNKVIIDEKDYGNPKYYTELVKHYKTQKVFIGNSPKNEMTTFSAGYGKKFNGNSILCKLGTNKYVFIGHEIYEFTTKDEIGEYYSPVGNNDVPYPVAVGSENVYFLIDNEYAYASKDLFEDFPKKYKWHDHAYSKLWGQEPFTEEGKTWKQSNMRKHTHKMKVKMIHKRI